MVTIYFNFHLSYLNVQMAGQTLEFLLFREHRGTGGKFRNAGLFIVPELAAPPLVLTAAPAIFA